MTKRHATTGERARSHAVLLGKGRYADERLGFEAEEGPRHEFVALSQALDADILSHASATARGSLVARLFRGRPHLGSALDFAARASRYKSCYVTGEDVGLPVALALAIRRWAGRLVVTVHNVTPRKARIFRLLGHQRFAALVVVSEKQRRALIEQCGIPAEKVVRVFNWVDDRYFVPLSCSGENAEPVVMACGAENRDYTTLIEAASRVSALFSIYAHGFFAEKAGGPAVEAANVRQMPRVPFDKLRDAYQNCDFVAVPLNDVSYAAGVTGLVEAMACGRPVIATRTTGLSDYFDAIDPACLVAPNDVDGMVSALNHLLSQDDSTRAAMGLRYRAWVEANCSLDQFIHQISALLRGNEEC